MQVSGDMIYPTNENGDIIPMKRDRICWINVRRSDDGTWELEVDIDGWCKYERWVWRPEDGDFREYLECLAPRKEYIYGSVNKDSISLIRGKDLVSVNVSGGYVDYSNGRRVIGSQFWLYWMRNIRKKWKKRKSRASGGTDASERKTEE